MPIYRELEHQPIGSISLEPALSVSGDTAASEVVATMRASRFGYVLVMDGGRLAGIFTEHDLLVRAVTPDGMPTAPVRRFMTPEPTTLDATAPLSHAITPMVEGGYHHIPIADGARGYLGVLTSHNLFHFLAELLPDRILNLPPRPHQRLRAPDGA
jgi:CBS domain-containing protein